MSMQTPAERRLCRLSNHLAQGNAPVSVNTAADNLKYTLPGGCFTMQERLFFEENGYIVIRGLYGLDDLEHYRKRFQELCDGTIDRPMTMTVMRDVTLAKSGKLKQGESNITKIQDFQDDEVLFQYVQDPRILQYVQNFTGPNIAAVHTMLINKPPDPGAGTSRHPMHQDLYYFPFRPAQRIVASWTAMQHIDRANGCLVVIPGTHKLPMRPHGYPNWEGGANAMYHGIQDMAPEELDKRVHLVMEPGDTVFFHPLLIHGSGTNTTTGFRKSISSHYADTNSYYVDVTDTPQKTIADEVEQQAIKRLGMKLEFADVWKMKSRLVQGVTGPLLAEVVLK